MTALSWPSVLFFFQQKPRSKCQLQAGNSQRVIYGLPILNQLLSFTALVPGLGGHGQSPTNKNVLDSSHNVIGPNTYN